MKRLKNSKFFLWFGKGTKAQVFVKKSTKIKGENKDETN